MPDLRFVWDERKDRSNQKKHRISFGEAQSVFLDEQAKLYSDPDHSDVEERFILLGLSLRLRVLIVCHCYREAESVVRIISARRANKDEEKDYWGRR